MSELSTGDLREMLRQILREERANQQPQEGHVEHVANCPGCYSKVIEALNKTSTVACDHCGLPLGNEEFARKLDHCPNCGRKELRKIRR